MGFSWNGATPSHPFLDGMFPEINHPAIGRPLFLETSKWRIFHEVSRIVDRSWWQISARSFPAPQISQCVYVYTYIHIYIYIHNAKITLPHYISTKWTMSCDTVSSPDFTCQAWSSPKWRVRLVVVSWCKAAKVNSDASWWSEGIPKGFYGWLVVWLPFFIFPYIGFLVIPTDFHIFQRGGPTTNQWFNGDYMVMLCDKKWDIWWFFFRNDHHLVNRMCSGTSPATLIQWWPFWMFWVSKASWFRKHLIIWVNICYNLWLVVWLPSILFSHYWEDHHPNWLSYLVKIWWLKSDWDDVKSDC